MDERLENLPNEWPTLFLVATRERGVNPLFTLAAGRVISYVAVAR
jgi:hypothetical protein